MRTVELFRDFDYRPHRRRTIRFHAGCTYVRVLELAAREIERAGAGRIIDDKPDGAAGGNVKDASHAWRIR